MEQRFIQSFINAADTVLASVLSAPVSVVELSTPEELAAQPLSGQAFSAARVCIQGDIEGQIVFAIAPQAARSLGAKMGGDISAIEIAGELANMVVGNAIARLNDSGFRFFVHPPEAHHQAFLDATPDADAVCLKLQSGGDTVHMSIAMRCSPEPAQIRDPYRN
jgi:CheY-specific phosphatase CheX